MYHELGCENSAIIVQKNETIRIEKQLQDLQLFFCC
ncbi:hypothetical protein FHS19_006591 [Paenibacillus rhizosphaerae]|uniref:Uncharacterized protein n=1 Tax=Paenibacillus rhizosphaerae TaxID=297318 RepID=A0A839TYA3_9BACL|nr:hypothetical protein [Paenibacillus rhizosphaerae]